MQFYYLHIIKFEEFSWCVNIKIFKHIEVVYSILFCNSHECNETSNVTIFVEFVKTISDLFVINQSYLKGWQLSNKEKYNHSLKVVWREEMKTTLYLKTWKKQSSITNVKVLTYVIAMLKTIEIYNKNIYKEVRINKLCTGKKFNSSECCWARKFWLTDRNWSGSSFFNSSKCPLLKYAKILFLQRITNKLYHLFINKNDVTFHWLYFQYTVIYR